MMRWREIKWDIWKTKFEGCAHMHTVGVTDNKTEHLWTHWLKCGNVQI